MTARDADETDREPSEAEHADASEESSGASVGEDPSDGSSETDEQQLDAAALSEIAEAPDGEVDDVLTAIVEGRDDSPDSSGTDGEEKAGATAESDVDDEPRADPDSVTVSEEFVAELEAVETETTARAIELLREEVSLLREDVRSLEADLEAATERADDFESRLKRKQADFQNYKKRQEKKLEETRQRATEDLIERLLDVRDNLERALEQDEDADIRSGVESTLDQFDQQLDRENVEQIEPEPGESPDPTRHEVLATVESDQPEDTIAHVHRPGYEIADKVLRPAQVTVSDGSNADGE